MKEIIKKRDWKKIGFTILIAFAIIAFWRGVWGLMDVYLFPQNHTLSLFLSLIIGIGILLLSRHVIKGLS